MTAPRLQDLPPLRRRRRRRLRDLKNVPVLPSLVTLGNVFFGFLAIAKVADALRVSAADAPFAEVVGYFEMAVILVFVAMLFDALDGRIARMTNQTTSFGAQLDSMADMVTFGVVPAFIGKVLVDWHARDANSLLMPHPKIYYVAAAIYVLCAALRLARYNVETGEREEDHREFRGLPSPAAAAVICSMVALLCTRYDEQSLSSYLLSQEHFDVLIRVMPLVLGTLGLLMVSRVPYPHAMHMVLKQRHSFPFLAGLVVLIFMAAIEWQLAILVLTVGYVIWGVLLGLVRLLTSGRLDGGRGVDDDDDDDLDVEVRHNPTLN
ncbi:MAG: phosphatidylcholine/phosphatidylserine synthase [Planctomycetota bacterium]|nr:phosphatidylcholine/phosphatidylserine synthase [Planctomycetota bacterium]